MYNINKLNFSYKDKIIFKNINLSIDQGKFITIIGPDGSGKTTLLNLLLYNLVPDSGEIFFFGQLLDKYSIKEINKIIAYIPQNINLKFPFSCFDFVSLARKSLKNKFNKLDNTDLEIINKCMEETNTLKLAEKKITEISDAEKQRVVFAKTLAQTSKVFLLDEAFSSLDIHYKIKFLDKLKEMIIKENVSIITVINDLNLTDIYSDIIIALNKGKVIKYGKKEDIMTIDFLESLFKVNIKKTGKQGIIIRPGILKK